MKTEKQMAMATAEFAERWKGTGNVSQSVRHIVSTIHHAEFAHQDRSHVI